MSKVVKIKQVHLYMGYTESAADTYAAMKLLADQGIPHTKLTYNDPAQHQGVFDSLNTWTFGKHGSDYRKEFKDFPILHWTEYHDDWEQVLECAYGIEEIKNSSLIKNKALIEA